MVEVSSLSILVVDDEQFIRTLVVRVAKSLGCTTIQTAENALIALEKLDNFSPDVILCDLNMPEMDGIEFMRHLSERNFTGGIALISGEDARIRETVASLAGSHDLQVLGHLAKPVTPKNLAGILDGYKPKTMTDGGQRGGFKPMTPEALKDHMDRGNLVAFFQPKVSISTKELIGVEALVRIRDDDGKIIGPFAFVGTAEEHGLIDELTDLMLKQSVDWGSQWQQAGLDIKISINYSVDSLSDLGIPEKIERFAREAGLTPKNIVLEVTETRLMEDTKAPLEVLTRLRLKGIGVSIDDFGTGFSSMEQLKRIPFTELKIDRAFVYGAKKDQSARAIQESSVALAKKLNLNIVAEGVEDQEDWDTVEETGCDVVQGYFVAKPMPGEEIFAWNEAWKKDQADDESAAPPQPTFDSFDELTVLVADDEPFSQKLILRVLNVLGIEKILTVSNGQEAIDMLIALDQDVDLVLTDIEMPVMDGYELARQIRLGKIPVLTKVPILMLTGNATEENEEKARVHNIEGFLAKPPQPDLIKQAIQQALGFS